MKEGVKLARISPEMTTLQDQLNRHVREGELYEKLSEERVRCYSCGHFCTIPEGRQGICKVRFNQGGKLYVPWGYVGGMQLDPIEKKPFFHAYPGAAALSFGMLGCDYHCSYCFPAGTMVVTGDGVTPIERIFDESNGKKIYHDGEVGKPEIQAMTSSGYPQRVRQAFRHSFSGPLINIKPYYLPSLRCTPEHSVYATTDSTGLGITPIPAKDLSEDHYLVVPKKYTFSEKRLGKAELNSKPKIQNPKLPHLMPLNTYSILSQFESTYKVPRQFDQEEVEQLMELSEAGVSSRVLGKKLGKDPSYIRYVRSKVRRGVWQYEKEEGAILEGERVRFFKEKHPGIPLEIPLSEEWSKLLGYYCAEGCIVQSSNRPNSYVINFSFSLTEVSLAEEVQRLLQNVLGVKSQIVKGETTLRVSVGKTSAALLIKSTSAALLIKSLCGKNAPRKRVPSFMFQSPREIVESFLNAYICGDGHSYDNCKVSVTTVSKELAYGVAWLALKIGRFPSLYENPQSSERTIEGRTVHQSPRQYTIVWKTGEVKRRKLIETEEYWLVPIRSITSEAYEGFVYNIEVEDDHNYLANFALVKNCQNHLTSQALRDPAAGVQPSPVTPKGFVDLAEKHGARVVTSTYNEPLITSEWAMEIFKIAKSRGLITSYVSNGNGTPEVLDYIQPWVDLYKVDLKSFDDKHYRSLGGVIDRVLETIKMLVEKGFWLEVVTLIIPGFNDSTEELREMAEFLVSVSPDIPWHVTAFHKDYKMQDPDNTPVKTLERAAKIGYEMGLNFVYAGNIPGRVGKYENTYCPKCKELLIERYGFRVLKNNIQNGSCPSCNTPIPGRWDKAPTTTTITDRPLRIVY